MSPRDLTRHPVHLGLDATAVPQPEFTGDMPWYEGYVERHRADGAQGRLVSMHSFSGPWEMWEMHPHGSEVVIRVAGSMVLHQEGEGGQRESIALEPGQYAINAPGVWHTADVDGQATALFITAGLGTEHRERRPDRRAQ